MSAARRIAVLGGGTAGFMAAAEVTRSLPECELFHVYDPARPAIGVGEGTLAHFPAWLGRISGLGEDELQRRCGVTRKYGIDFEGWGQRHARFTHHFYPAGQAHGYHISASAIVDLLATRVRATVLRQPVTRLDSDGTTAQLVFAGSDPLEVDFVFDARGFPAPGEPGLVPLTIIPTNAALIRQGPPVSGQVKTRTVARPHGWLFIIPLATRTAYGYVYDSATSTPAAVDDDLQQLLAAEAVSCEGEPRHLIFPTFTRIEIFDGAVFRIGNAASFLEPLEATALGVAHSQIEAALRWPLGLWRLFPRSPARRAADLATLNRFFYRHTLRLALFLGWHYSQGSLWPTPFWDKARANYHQARNHFPEPALVQDLDTWIAGAPQNPSPRAKFGLWPAESFAELAAGLGS